MTIKNSLTTTRILNITRSISLIFNLIKSFLSIDILRIINDLFHSLRLTIEIKKKRKIFFIKKRDRKKYSNFFVLRCVPNRTLYILSVSVSIVHLVRIWKKKNQGIEKRHDVSKQKRIQPILENRLGTDDGRNI